MHRVLITGATGRVGREVVSQLLGTDTHVRALSRNSDFAGLPDGVETCVGDLTLPATLDPCLDGIDAVFLVWTAPAAAVPAVIERIAKHVRRIVFLSSPHQTAHPLFQAAQPNPMSAMQAEIERSIQASGLAWTFLRPGMFAANALGWWAPQIRSGDVVRWPYPLAVTAPIHERDIAAVAVLALRNPACDGAEYVLTGPQSLTHFEQVSIIGDVLGRRLRFEEITPEEWRGEFKPLAVADMLLKAWSAAVGQPALVTSTVASLLGTPPRAFREWVIDNEAGFHNSKAPATVVAVYPSKDRRR
jgi:uncharacterized protein YbjT (DUF2867 family)